MCGSVSGNYDRSEQHVLGEYQSAAEAPRWRRRHRRYGRKQRQTQPQHHMDSGEPQERHEIGFRRRLSRQLLPRRRPLVTAPTGAAGTPKPAINRRYYRRLSLYHRSSRAVVSSRVAVTGSAWPSSNSGCEMFTETSGPTRRCATFSTVRGTSMRLIQLPVSLSNCVRRGTLLLARRMQRRTQSTGGI